MLLKNKTVLFLCPNYEDRYNIGNHHFRLAIAKRFETAYFYGPGYKGYDEKIKLVTLVDKHKPDILFLMFPTRHIENNEGLARLNYRKFDGLKVMYDTDSQSTIWPRCKFINKHKIDFLFLGNNYMFIPDHEENIEVDCKVYWLPFGVNQNYFKNYGRTRTRAAMFLGCTNESNYPDRLHMIAIMKRAFGIRFFFNSGNVYNRKKYVDLLNDHKIFVSAGDISKGFFMKNLEVMACGCLLISQATPCFDKLGFVNGEHYISYDLFNDLIERTRYYLMSLEEWRAVTKAGFRFAIENHTWEHRVDEMLRIIYDEKKESSF